MSILRPIFLLGGVFAIAAFAVAEEPPYRVHNGEMIPTRITSPQKEARPATAPGARRAILEQSTSAEDQASPSTAQDESADDASNNAAAPDDADSNGSTTDVEADAAPERPARFRGSYRHYRYGLHHRSTFERLQRRYGYGGGWLWADPYVVDAYEADRHDALADERRIFNQEDMDERAGRLLSAHQKAMQIGLEQLRRGEYAGAQTSLMLAAQLDNGDPACRIHLAQAELARGQYEEAAASLRRAIELQPNAIYLPLNLDRAYANPQTLGRHTDVLAAHVQANPASAHVHFLLGFLQFQLGRSDESFTSLRRVAAALPKDEPTQMLLKLVQPEKKTLRASGKVRSR